MRDTPASWVRRFVRGLQFDKCARRGTSTDERNIRPTNTWIDKLGNHREPGTKRHFAQNAFEQLLKRRCESRFLNRCVRAAKVADTLRIAQKVVENGHYSESTNCGSGIYSRLVAMTHALQYRVILYEAGQV